MAPSPCLVPMVLPCLELRQATPSKITIQYSKNRRPTWRSPRRRGSDRKPFASSTQDKNSPGVDVATGENSKALVPQHLCKEWLRRAGGGAEDG